MLKKIKEKFFHQKQLPPTQIEKAETHIETQVKQPISTTILSKDDQETLDMLYEWLKSLNKEWIKITTIADKLSIPDNVAINLVCQLRDQHKIRIHANGDRIRIFEKKAQE
jgi:hypothetical protein